MITIDYQSKLPLYEQIAKRFQTLILKGALPPDSQMPSVRSLSRLIANGKELGVKRAEFTQLVDRIYRKEDSHDRVKNA